MLQVEAAPKPREKEEREIEDAVFHADNCTKYIALVKNQGLLVDDDNEPAPKNIPTQGVVEVNNVNQWE